ncbi:MAG: DNA mismatch repair endonuclease MutL [Dysgonamonadaceae bacterium]|jgi:DNA mismatch repair protein MutL|nr:DNA mismatch repair endonuclease MutL [Dysgonamonadaceae bacterium]
MDIIHLLPDSIANQIAAGEVIQRPASVVKELVENAIDAEADRIQIIIKDAGRSLIQIIDNGKGMSETDARMAFERHATSKINTANDLFTLRTLGFRGEALASIAAVAQVELKTRGKEDKLGTMLQIAGSRVEKQEAIMTDAGSCFSVKNLFFNIPARRKFLKSNETEFRNILTEFERIALVYPKVSFTLLHNGAEIFSLPASGLKQRIINISGKKISSSLLPVQINTSFMNISGFVGSPESSKRRGSSQYFFVNGRYMRHPYFHRAVMLAFESFIPAGEQPNYFIYLDVDPESIDVNIHPTKTEIKFENEQHLFQVIASSVKEAIAVPSLEFNREGAIDMPVYTGRKNDSTESPKIDLRSDYNPFKENRSHERPKINWEQLYEENKEEKEIVDSPQPDNPSLFEINNQSEIVSENQTNILPYKGRFLIAPLKSGLSIIDQRQAHIRILFDDYMQRMYQKQGVSQRLLFPEIIFFTPGEATVLPCVLDDLAFIGFDLSDLGNHSYSINGVPAGLENVDYKESLQNMIDKVLETGCEVKEEVSAALALALAKKAAISDNKILSDEEAMSLLARLFSSASPNYTPDGKLIVSILSEEEINKRFK